MGEQVIVITNNNIKAIIDGKDFEMTLEQFNILSTLVFSARNSNMGCAYIDEKGVHTLYKE